MLLPSRGRARSLGATVARLFDTAAEPDRVEVLIAADPDDQPTGTVAAVFGDAGQQVRVWTAPERYGYARLHEYYNGLAELAVGEWCLLWNDDAAMLTAGWDSIIHDQPPGVLWLQQVPDRGGNFFPAWPRAWTAAWGHVSLSPNVDVWVSEVGARLGRQTVIPVQVKHDRADITGGHQDATYKEGRGVMGAYSNHPDYDTPPMREARFRDTVVTRRLLG